jgi:hypothetical protein
LLDAANRVSDVFGGKNGHASSVRSEQMNSRRPNWLRRGSGIDPRKYGTRESRGTRTCDFCDIVTSEVERW